MSKTRPPLKMPDKRAQEAEAWVNAPKEAETLKSVTAPPGAAAGSEKMRLNVDMPAELHRRFKTACAAEGVKMAEAVTELVEGWITRQGQGK